MRFPENRKNWLRTGNGMFEGCEDRRQNEKKEKAISIN
jgi:hypothetical protein